MGKVHMMKLAAMEQYREGPLTGHRFKITIDVTDPIDCTLSWYERTDHPYVDTEHWHAGEWHDLAVHADISNVFIPWSNHEASTGRHVIEIIDPPGTRYGQRTLDFCIACSNEAGEGFVLQLQQVISADRLSFRFDNSKDCRRVNVIQALKGVFRYASPFGQKLPDADED